MHGLSLSGDPPQVVTAEVSAKLVVLVPLLPYCPPVSLCSRQDIKIQLLNWLTVELLVMFSVWALIISSLQWYITEANFWFTVLGLEYNMYPVLKHNDCWICGLQIFIHTHMHTHTPQHTTHTHNTYIQTNTHTHTVFYHNLFLSNVCKQNQCHTLQFFIKQCTPGQQHQHIVSF